MCCYFLIFRQHFAQGRRRRTAANVQTLWAIFGNPSFPVTSFQPLWDFARCSGNQFEVIFFNVLLCTGVHLRILRWNPWFVFGPITLKLGQDMYLVPRLNLVYILMNITADNMTPCTSIISRTRTINLRIRLVPRDDLNIAIETLACQCGGMKG